MFSSYEADLFSDFFSLHTNSIVGARFTAFYWLVLASFGRLVLSFFFTENAEKDRLMKENY